MAHLLEALERAHPAGYPLGGRVGSQQIRVLGLDPAQLVEQRVVGVVTDRRVVEDVVVAVVLGDLVAQLGRPPGSVASPHRAAGTPTAAPSSVRSHPSSRSSPARSVRSKWIGVIATLPRATAARSVPRSSSNEGSKP